MANLGTNAALANQVFAHLIAPVQAELERAVVARDPDHYRTLLRPVYTKWLRQCPRAVSPRVTSDDVFRERAINYMVEGMVCREFDPGVHSIGQQLIAVTRLVQRIPQPDGNWLVGDGIWRVAELFKRQMDQTYRLIEQAGVLALDPEQAPVSVQLRMEYSYFCQNWLPKIPPADADRFLAYFGLNGRYSKVNLADFQTRKCGGCGDELKTVPGAQAVICESCGRKLDIAGGEVPCGTCGAPLSFPVGVSALECPYCHSATRRV